MDVPVIKRSWLNDLYNSRKNSENCPKEWVKWIERGIYTPLLAEKVLLYRSKFE